MRKKRLRILIPLLYTMTMTLVAFYAWNEQRIVRRGGDGPLYRNLMDGTAWIRRGFISAELEEIPPSSEWVRFNKTPLRVSNSLLPDLPKRTFLSPMGNEAEEFTIIIPVELDDAAISFLNANPSKLPGIFLGYIGENWEIYFNGTPVRSEIHMDAAGRIREKRTWRSVYVPIDKSLCFLGTNILALRIIGDPAYLITGLSYNSPHYMDDYALIEARQNKFPLIALCGIFGFTGIYYLAVFLLLRRRAEIFNIYFSIFSILLCVYIAMRHGLLRNLIPDSNVTLPLEFASLIMSMAVFYMFIESAGRGKVIKPTWAFFFFCLYLSLTQIFFCAQYGEEAVKVWNVAVILYYAFIIINDIFVFYFFGKKRDRTGSEDSEILIINIITGTLAIFLCGIYEILDILFFHYSYSLFPYSTFVVQIGMNLALAARFSGMYKKLEQSNITLENTVKERTRELETQTAIAVKASLYKSEFLATMSHEIKTPLTVVSVYVQQAKELFKAGGDGGGTISDTILHSLTRAQEETMRTARITDNALRLSSMQESRNQMKALDMAALLETSAEAYRVMLEKRGNRLVVNIADRLPPVYGSADSLIQVMVNLLSNANAHTENGEIVVQARADKKHIKVTVADNGSGISPELLPRLFERRISGGGGTGIGLAICKEIIASHQGTIEIESTSTQGTTVSFRIPHEKNLKEDNNV